MKAKQIKYHITYMGELFISDKKTQIQAIKEFKDYWIKTTNDPILFFNIKIEKVIVK